MIDQGQRPEKVRQPIPPLPEKLAIVRTSPGFMAFADVVGLAILDGHAADAFRMLVHIGAPDRLAHEIVEGWPLVVEQQKLRTAGVSVREEAACRLACYLRPPTDGDWRALVTSSRWPRLMMEAAAAAVVAREENQDSSKEGSSSGG